MGVFIDIHAHARKAPGFAPRGKPERSTPAQLLALYDAYGIEKGAILPESSPEFSLDPQSSAEAVEMAKASAGRLVAFCCVDPRALSDSSEAPLGELLAYWKGEGCKGLGEIVANLPFDDPRVENLFRCAEEQGLPATFHMATRLGGAYGLYDEPGMPLLERALKRFPGLKILGHSQAFWAEISELANASERDAYPKGPLRKEGRVQALLRSCPNLYGDLSAGSGFNALARDEEHAARFIEEFQDRLLFGTDICAPDSKVPLPAFLLRLKDSGAISGKAFLKVARENAVKLLGL